ncbi:MAG TPA: glycosyltransferase, partial [Thermodesulfobacteriota bacterium]
IYGREADVIAPPVDLDRFAVSTRDDGYYLVVSAFAPYKRLDLAIEAFTRMRRPLKVIGGGQEERRLKALAGPGIEFLGQCSDDEVREAYAGCRALVFPGEEDFGIVPLEAMACGKPVIAYGRGGVVETVVPLDGRSVAGDGEHTPTGVFFHEQTVEALSAAVETFEAVRHRFDPEGIRRHVERYDRARFRRAVEAYVTARYAAFRGRPAQAAAGSAFGRRPE